MAVAVNHSLCCGFLHATLRTLGLMTLALATSNCGADLGSVSGFDPNQSLVSDDNAMSIRDPNEDAGDTSSANSSNDTASGPVSPVTTSGPLGSTSSGAPRLGLDVNQFIRYASDNTSVKSLALGIRFNAAAHVTPTASQKNFLASASQQPPIPSSGDNSDLVFKAFPVTLFPTNGKASPYDIEQHAIGNCGGDSALASLAYSHADFVSSVIRATGSDAWQVSMVAPNGSALTVAVDNQFVATKDGHIGAVSGRNGQANWATVLEKAIMKYNVVYGAFKGTGVGSVGGIGSETTLPMFTGTGLSYAFARGVLNPQQLRDQVRNALDNGMMVIGGFGKVAYVNGFQTVTSHAYAILWPKDDTTMISMRNPWGAAKSQKTGKYDSSADGVVDIAMDGNWAATIDLRVIAPGKAQSNTRPTPYVLSPSRLLSRFEVEHLERDIEWRQQAFLRAGSSETPID